MKSIVSAVLLVVVFASGAFGVDEILKHRSVGPALSQSEYESDAAIYIQGGDTGAIPYYDAAVGLLRGLGIGDEGQILAVEDGRPAWAGGEWDLTTLDDGVERGPIHHYRMNDVGAAVYTVEDSGSNPINLTASVSADDWTTDVAKIGGAFQTSSSMWASSAVPYASLRTKPISVCSWFRVDSSLPKPLDSTRITVAGTSRLNERGYSLKVFYYSGSWSAEAYANVFYSIAEDVWYHGVAVYTADSTTLYINGSTVRVNPAYTVSSDQYIAIKRSMDNFTVLNSPVQVDDMRIYDYALSADQVERLYNRGHGTEDNLTTGVVVAAQSAIHDAEARTYVATQLTSDPATLYFAAGGATVGTWSSDTLHVAGDLVVDGVFDTDLSVGYADAAGTAGYATQAGTVLEIKDEIRHEDQSSTLSIQDTLSGYDELRWTTGNGLQFTVDRLFGAILRVPGSINLAAVAAGMGLEIQAQRDSSYSQFLWDAYEAKLTLRQHDTATTDVLEARGNATVTGNATVGGTLGITGTLGVTGAATLGGLNVDANTLAVDAANNRVGVNKASPTVALDVTGAVSASGAISGASSAVTGNATVGGTLGVTGASTLTGNATVMGQLISDSIKDVSDQGLVLALGMDSRSISGTTLLDSSAYANHGAMVSGALPVNNGGFNNGGHIYFDGQDDRIELTKVAINNSHTVSMWIKPFSVTDGARHTIFYVLNGGDALSVEQYNTSIRYTTMLSSVSRSKSAESVLNTTSYNHIVATYNATGSVTALYVNGVSYSSSFAAILSGSTERTLIGMYTGGGQYYKGYVDDVRYYDRCLSDSEIKALYDSRASIHPPKLALYSNTTQNVYSPVWFSGDVSALSFTDRTPGWDKSPDAALAAIVATGSKTITIGKGKDIKTKAEIDHDTLPIEAQVVLGVDKATSEVIHGRDLGMMITIQSEAIKALEARLKKLEGEKGVQK